MAKFKIPRYKYKGDTIPLQDFYQDAMNYQSPIELIHRGWETKVEDDIFKAILNYGINVDKDELIKALEYDRDQYEKGYADGCRGAMDRIKAEVAREIFAEIEKLSRKFMNDQHYIFGDMLWDINELKKKYTGENN